MWRANLSLIRILKQLWGRKYPELFYVSFALSFSTHTLADMALYIQSSGIHNASSSMGARLEYRPKKRAESFTSIRASIAHDQWQDTENYKAMDSLYLSVCHSQAFYRAYCLQGGLSYQADSTSGQVWVGIDQGLGPDLSFQMHIGAMEINRISRGSLRISAGHLF